MAPHRTAQFFFAIVVAAVLVITLYPEPSDSTNPIDSGDQELIAESAQEQAPTIATTDASFRTELEQSKGEQSLGRRELRVLDPQGEPVAGAQVFVFLQDDDELSEWQANWMADESGAFTDTVISMANALLTTNREGMIGLPESGFGMAGAITEQGEGAVAFGFFEEAEGPIELRLRVGPRVLVVVQDASGRPLEGVHVGLMSAAQADIEAAQRESNEGVVPWRPLDGGLRRTDAHGRAWIPCTKPHPRIPEQEAEASNRRFRVQAWMPFSELLHQEIELGVDQEVHLQAEATGTLRVFMENYPSGAIPIMESVTTQRSIEERRRQTAVPLMRPDDDGAWRFEHIPLGGEFSIQPVLGSFKLPGQLHWSNPTSLDANTVLGPTAEGEVVDVTLRLDLAGALTGRLVHADGSPFGRPDDPMRMRLLGHHAAFPDRSIAFDLALGDDGWFFARPSKEPNHWNWEPQVHDLDLIYFEARLRNRGTWSLDQDAEANHGSWARVPLALAPSSTGHDLGEVTMSQADPMLQIKVVDEQGVGIRHVELSISAYLHYPELGLDGTWSGARVTGSKVTEADGRWLLGGPSFDTALFSGYLDLLAQRYRVRAKHREYLAETVEFERGQDYVEIELRKSAEIRGEVRLPNSLHSVRIRAVPSGATPDARAAGHSAVQHGNPEDRAADGATIGSFEITPLAAGSYDLLFSLAGGAEQVIYRATGVIAAVEGGDPLALIDLEPWVDFFEVEAHKPNGELVDSRYEQGVWLEFGVIEEQRGQFNQLYVPSYEGAWRVASPKGTEAEILVRSKDYRTIDLRGFRGGRHVIQLEPKPVLQLSYAGRDRIPSGWSLRLDLRQDNHFWNPVTVPPQGADFAFAMDQPGEFTATWIARNAEKNLSAHVRQPLSISEEQLQANRPIVLPIPEEVFTKIEQRSERAGG